MPDNRGDAIMDALLDREPPEYILRVPSDMAKPRNTTNHMKLLTLYTHDCLRASLKDCSSSVVCNLGVILDQELTFAFHIQSCLLLLTVPTVHCNSLA